MIITIDGPVASGKSSVARLLAKRLGYLYLNTGLLFRAVAYLLYIKDTSLKNIAEIEYTGGTETGPQILYKNSNITPLLKTPDMDQLASKVATIKEVRDALLAYERAIAKDRAVVAEGRDTGSVVFPDADYKFFITALTSVRAKRWQAFQHTIGNEHTLEQSIEHITTRDLRDTAREQAPLCIPEDAHIIDTSNMSIEQAVEACLALLKGAA